ncbi:MAG: hypothetical protein A3G32_04105 [Deltaproteobacteria bacterium RIFCSPLOWO2_12_FULL_40_28]|nr:MAG: hypothetical protein A3C45_08215 [Deltaproteobacteria bacterium RIFCSPHIGHO2_02_FULL_40_28]OGQ19554.1 MAG: hypothetical protein A3E27_07410 [Deltaproteobacteria bacterium RIFCSPHIGHO2_12_FULL_40_32]OGQ40831.1 MAG: hypothetical protein A3I69_02825 [Deltaproteobacteria bacterium RIFCSPLOWO2_02_FULL_40_36]OGQ53946.1 MAG: hypothetical protein A3G32_04105 [Deltaproteobacteria bacterium RIFCSPLOWO2_12_FULL_40_28]
MRISSIMMGFILTLLSIRVLATVGPVDPGSSTSPSAESNSSEKKIDLPYQPAEEKKKKEAPVIKKEEASKIAPAPPPPVVLPFILSKWPENIGAPDPEGF